MNKKYGFLLFVPLLIQSIPSKKELVARYKKQKNKIFLLSYPRSGNTWMRYCLESLTKRPTLEYLGGNEFPGLNEWWPFSMKFANIDISKDIIWKIHFRYVLKKAGYFNKNRDKIILLLRDYKEALIRNKGIHIFDGNFFIKKAVQRFLDNLVLFDEWSPENRLLIHYEDLIKSPKPTTIPIFIGTLFINLSELILFRLYPPTCFPSSIPKLHESGPFCSVSKNFHPFMNRKTWW